MPARTELARSIFLAAILSLGSFVTVNFADAHGVVSADQRAIETPWGSPGDPSRVTRTVTIVGTEIKFNVTRLSFRKGDTVRFVFVNKGEQPHEFMIADAAEQAEHRKMMAEMSGTSMPAAEANVVDAKPGETKELIWRFTKRGKFQFACNYVGHAEAGMVGTIIVR